MVLATIIIAIFTTLAFVISIISLLNVNKHNKIQNFIELVNEYKSSEFLNCINKMIKLRDAGEKNNKGLYEYYKTYSSDYEKAKRTISQFFQIIEFLREYRILDDKLVFGYWSFEILNGYLDTIIKIEDDIGKDGDYYSDPSKIRKLLNDAKKRALAKNKKVKKK